MFVVYKPETGEITQVTIGPDLKTYGPMLDAHGLFWVFEPKIQVDILKHYVDVAQQTIELRPEMQLKMEGTKLSGIPQGSQVFVWFENMQVANEIVNDGFLELSSETQGKYVIQCVCWPYISFSVEVVI